MPEIHDTRLVNNVVLTLVARFAMVFATAVGLPVAGWMMNRAVSSVDRISEKIDVMRDQSMESMGSIRLMQQLQQAHGRSIEDHEARLRKVETPTTRAN